ncbi:ATP-binding protein [Burkholderia plantarii]|uniref:ATP-binding protein n=1 Tax=Burkholderia plantarii TaxID=41899 RepID=UPI0018DC6522|nr:ATP-binding protein [Burkholderia plantarii]MBI0329662.1 response regulator [Burkholderia plantarii]
MSKQDTHDLDAEQAGAPDFLRGGGALGRSMRAHAWDATSLGVPDAWPQSLRSAVGICLGANFPIAIYWGPELVLLYNDAWSPIPGAKHPWALGRPGVEVWPEIWAEIGPLFRQVLDTGIGVWQHDQLLPMRRHGYTEECYFNFTFSPIRGDTGAVEGIFNAVLETTSAVISKRRERVLRELAEALAEARDEQGVFSAAVDFLAERRADLPFCLLYQSGGTPAVARLRAATGVESGGPAAPDSIALEADAGAVWPLAAVSLTGRAVRVDDLQPRLALALAPGPWPEPCTQALILPVVTTAHPATVDTFLVAGASPRRALDDEYHSFLQRISAHIAAALASARAYAEERRRADALAEIDRAKTAFFTNVSHEFRTPLTLMLGPIEELLAVPDQFPPAAIPALQVAHRNGLRLLRLVNSLLDFSRLEAGRLQARFVRTDLAKLTMDLASNFRSLMERANLSLTVDCEPLAAPVAVDRGMWEKIVLNLLSNAFKFTFAGGVSVTLRQREHVELIVSDTGIGIAAEQLPRIFERFHRVEGARGRSFEGSGIGLALVEELVRMHGGRIDVVSAAGQGTTFTVSIPPGLPSASGAEPDAGPRMPDRDAAQAFLEEAARWLPDAEEDAYGGVAARPEAQAPPPRNERSLILVADDNADMRAYVQRLLGDQYDVASAVDGHDALRAAKHCRPDLILADIMMPGLDGIGLLETVRRDKTLRDVPVILLSARAGEEARVHGMQAGADDYLVKPFSARELVVRVGALLKMTAQRRKSEDRFRALVSASSNAVYSMNADWTEMRFLEGRDFIADTQAPSSTWLERYVDPEDRPTVLAHVREAIRTKGRFELEHRVRRADGSLGWTLSRAIPVLDKAGELVEWFGMAIDTSERKRVEIVLRDNAAWLEAQKEAFQAAVDNAPLPVSLDILARAAVAQIGGEARCAFYLADAGQTELTRIPDISEDIADNLERFPISADSFACGLAGYTRQPVVTPDVDDDPRWKDWLWLARQHAYRACWVFPVETSVGKVVGTFAMYHPVPRTPTDRDHDLALRLTFCAAIIISRHKEAEERARGVEALRLADRQKDEFLAMLAHELRNPLAPIANASELLSRIPLRDPQVGFATDIIRRQTTQLSRLVDDLLDVSRITQGRIVLQRQPIELAGIISQAVETIAPRLRERRHRLTVETAGDHERLWVEGDMARLVQCVSNILANSVKYTDPGGAIGIWTGSEGSVAVIRVSDNGAGISAELLPHVFDLFVQSERTLDRALGGLGVGLAIVKRLVAMHGGTISAHSQGLGNGSTFEIRLPRIAQPAALQAHDAQTRTSARRVLIVDDNADAADSLSILLGLQGHTVEVAYSAEDAIRRAETFCPQVALLDIGLPRMSGYELARTLRAMPQLAGTRLVAVTGYGQTDDVRTAREAGFDEHLVKPVEPSALERSLAQP